MDLRERCRAQHHQSKQASHSDTCHALAGGREKEAKLRTQVCMASSVRTCGVHDGPACVWCVRAYVSCCKWSGGGDAGPSFPLGRRRHRRWGSSACCSGWCTASTENSSFAGGVQFVPRHGRPSPFPGTGGRVVRSTPPPPWGGWRRRGPSSSLLDSPFHLPALDAVANETLSAPPYCSVRPVRATVYTQTGGA